jgi:predicted nucleotidyltransferase
VSETTQQGIRICIDINAGDQKPLFRISAADDILHLLADAHEAEFTVAELVDATDVTRSTVWRAVDLLHEIGAVEIRETPQRNYITINRDRLQKDDPILAIKQSEFQDPVRTFVEQVRDAVSESEEIENLLGIIVFGSVARGEADRQSDIDLFVVIEGTRTTARRRVADVVGDLSEQRFDGDRFDFEPYVESAESAHRAGPKLREIFHEGITVYGSERLQLLQKEVFEHE